MSRTIWLIMKKTTYLIIALSIIVLTLVQCRVIWLPPKIYTPDKVIVLNPPVMTLREYTTSGLINTHARPYIYQITNSTNGGAVYVFGAAHSKDPKHPQVAMMDSIWNLFNPTTAMLEGRLGYLITWLHNPIEKKGESGFTARKAKKKGIELFTWEPGRENEINELIHKGYHPKLVAAFFSLGVHNNNWKNFSAENQNKEMMNAIDSKTKKYSSLKGLITSVNEIDSIWKAECPNIPSWRSYKHPKNGWPSGKLEDISELTSYIRDEHLCRSIIDLVRKGQRVFVTMGASHAVTIERTLKAMIQ